MTDHNSTPHKACTRCQRELPATADNFFRLKGGKFGLASRCKPCAYAAKVETNRAWAEKNKDRLREYQKAYREENAEVLKAVAKAKYERFKPAILEKRKEYFSKNSAARNAYAAARRAAHPERIAEQRKTYNAARYGVDLSYTLRHRVGVAVRDALRGRRKSGPTFELLGYSLEELRSHLISKLQDGMTEQDLLCGKIHIDHIRPVSSFRITSDSCPEFKKCWALENLQPLWAKDNLRKGAKYEPA